MNGYEKVEAARASARAAKQRRQAQAGSEFVNLELSKEQKLELRSTFDDLDTLGEALTDLLSDGTKVTCKYDERNSCAVAFAFAAEDSSNAGYILTGRGRDATRALRELVYKHRVILDGEWAQYHNRSSEGEGDDW